MASNLGTVLHWIYLAIIWFINFCLVCIFEERKVKLTKPKCQLVMKSATDLAQQIRTREVTSAAVVQAFIDRIKAVNPLVNAVVAERYDLALCEAAKIDNVLDGDVMPEDYSFANAPFLGVPITVKECFAVKGLPQTSGLLCRKGYVADTDAPVVSQIRQAGGIPIGVTNLSELCVSIEANNLVYGRTNNPYHLGRTAGGSSGGEGSIIAAAGSVIGIGSDIGGSIRYPAFFNGIFGHKPTKGIVSNDGQFPLPDGDAILYLSTGPMCRYACDLLPLLKIMVKPEIDKHFLDKKVDVTDLKYFYMVDDGETNPDLPVHNEIKQAMNKVIKHFQVMGTSVRELSNNKLKYGSQIWAEKMSNSDKTDFSLQMGNGIKSINAHQELLKWLIGKATHTLPIIQLGLLKSHSTAKKVDDMSQLSDDLLKEFQDLLQNNGVFLYPTYPVPAPYHNQCLMQRMFFRSSYTNIFNILGLPATQVPLGLTSDGIPVGIQVIGNLYQDHLTIAIAREIERVFKGWAPPFET